MAQLYVCEAFVKGERRRYVGVATDAEERIHRIKLGKSASFLRAKGAKRPGTVDTIKVEQYATRENALFWELVEVLRLANSGFRVRGGPYSSVKLGGVLRDEFRGAATLLARSDDPEEAVFKARSEVKRVRCHLDDTCFHCESGEHYIGKPAATSRKRLFKACARLLLFLLGWVSPCSLLLSWH